MRGVGEATGAITVVNALPVGIGSAIGIELKATATVELEHGVPQGGFRCTPPESDTPLVRAAVELATASLAAHEVALTALTIRSEVPPAKGLKSSSAVASSICRAIFDAVGAPAEPLATARLAAKIGRSSRTSATGALDDALAGLCGGLVVTDNRADRLLAARPLDPDLHAAVWVPAGNHPAAPTLAERFAFERAASESAVDRVLGGAWPEAMELNSGLVERALGYEYAELRADCRRAGAVASGVTGLGPAFAAVAPAARIDRVADCFERERSVVLRVPLSRAPPPGPEGRR